MKQRFDTAKFSESIRIKRQIQLRLGLREAAPKIGISFATLSRMENEAVADINNIIKVCQWLKMPITDFITSKK